VSVSTYVRKEEVIAVLYSSEVNDVGTDLVIDPPKATLLKILLSLFLPLRTRPSRERKSYSLGCLLKSLKT
jgi:hypothetical protein